MLDPQVLPVRGCPCEDIVHDVSPERPLFTKRSVTSWPTSGRWPCFPTRCPAVSVLPVPLLFRGGIAITIAPFGRASGLTDNTCQSLLRCRLGIVLCQRVKALER